MKKVPKKIKDIIYRKRTGKRGRHGKARGRGGGGRRRKTKGLGLTIHGCVRSEVLTTLNV
jgi:hypothetical protein